MNHPALQHFLDCLVGLNIYFEIAPGITGAIVVTIYLHGEKWEVRFHQNNEVDCEVFGPAIAKTRPNVGQIFTTQLSCYVD